MISSDLTAANTRFSTCRQEAFYLFLSPFPKDGEIHRLPEKGKYNPPFPNYGEIIWSNM